MDDIPMADSSDTDNDRERDVVFASNITIAQILRNRRVPPPNTATPIMTLPAGAETESGGSTSSDKSTSTEIIPDSTQSAADFLPSDPEVHPRIVALYPGVDTKLTKLPTQWSLVERHPNIFVGSDKLVIRFRPSRQHNPSGENASAVRANYPIPHACGIYYFEISILPNASTSTSTRLLGIGIMEKSIDLARLPGWDLHSYGYHGDDGNFFSASGKGRPYGPKFGPDDTIGCGLNFATRRVFFTKNGENLGYLDVEKVSLDFEYYPVVGMQTTDAVVKTNFGQEPFMYNIEDDMRQTRNSIRTNFINFELPSEKLTWMNEVVLDWLIYTGYADAAECFANTTNLGLKPNVDKIRKRSDLINDLKEGRTENAIKQLIQEYPQIVADKKELMVVLYLQDFIDETMRVAKFQQNQTTDGTDRKSNSPIFEHFNDQLMDEPSSSTAPTTSESTTSLTQDQRRRTGLKRRNSPTIQDEPRRARNGNMVDVSNGNGVTSQRNGHIPGPSNGTTTIIAEDLSSVSSNHDYDDTEMTDLTADASSQRRELLSAETVESYRTYEPVIQKARIAMKLFREIPEVSEELHDLIYRCFDMMTCPAKDLFTEYPDLCSPDHRHNIANVLRRCILEDERQETLPKSARICSLIDKLKDLRSEVSRYAVGGITYTDVDDVIFGDGLVIEDKTPDIDDAARRAEAILVEAWEEHKRKYADD